MSLSVSLDRTTVVRSETRRGRMILWGGTDVGV